MNYLLLASVLSLSCQGAGSDNDKAAANQRKLKDAEWTWPKNSINVLWCIYLELPDFEVQMNWSQNRITRAIQVQLLKDGKQVCAFNAHPSTALVRDRQKNKLFVTDFHFIRPGCAVIAFDLTAGKELWKTTLHGLRDSENPGGQSKPQTTSVNIVHEHGILIVYGKEGNRRYIELIEADTGKIIGNKKLEKE